MKALDLALLAIAGYALSRAWKSAPAVAPAYVSAPLPAAVKAPAAAAAYTPDAGPCRLPSGQPGMESFAGCIPIPAPRGAWTGNPPNFDAVARGAIL